MGGPTCFFIGHREADASILPQLFDVVHQHIREFGVREFIVGQHGGFDRMATFTVIAAKKEYPYIRLYLLLPYHPAESKIDLLAGFDGSYYPEGMERVPRKFAIVRANQYAVNHADYLIAYAWHPASNARNVVEYAQRREVRGLIKVTQLNTSRE